MITGLVDELYAYRHHFKWWREVKLEQLKWAHEIDDNAVKPDPATPDEEAEVALKSEAL